MLESEPNLFTGRLFLVATPIGNLGDITYRAVEIMRAANVILAEDTRRARILCQRYEVTAQLVSNHDWNEALQATRVVGWVREGKKVALISDAGTPGISDPGYRAIRAIIDAGLPLEVIPGPTAVTTALVLSGLPVHRFVFEGFLPTKKGRQTRLKELATESRTIILFEAPHRLAKALAELVASLGGDRPAAVARELTKIHEEVRRGTLAELEAHYRTNSPKGEIVIVVAGKDS